METITSAQYKQLKESSKDIEMFTLEGRVVYAKVVDVYDGDTCKINMFLHGDVLKRFTVRMMGYDSPEMKTKDTTEKKFGIRSKTVLTKLVLNKVVKLECLEFDKYGRILGRIYLKNKEGLDFDVNSFMISNHLGYSYEGETKSKFNDLLTGGYYSMDSIEKVDHLVIPELVEYPYLV
jgi:endonuclease YncB( thermonuclease family)